MPHGWGHDRPGAQLNVARSNPGVNSNRVNPSELLDLPSGNAEVNGVPVTLQKVTPSFSSATRNLEKVRPVAQNAATLPEGNQRQGRHEKTPASRAALAISMHGGEIGKQSFRERVSQY